MISKKTLSVLEFDVILSLLSTFSISESTKEAIKKIIPLPDKKNTERLLGETGEAYLVKEKYLLNPVTRFDDILVFLEKAEVGATLSMGELLKISGLLRSCRIAKNDIEGTGSDIALLKDITAFLIIPAGLEKQITDCIISENEMSDSASDKLRSVRRKLLQASAKLKEKLSSYTKNSEHSKYLQDNIVTIRGGRYVLPVRSEFRGEIGGLIHDQSASGATVFIEPFPVIELNNELKSLELEEAREIERILQVLSGAVADNSSVLSKNTGIMTELDLIFARSAFSASYKSTKPKIGETGYINLIDSRHPLIDAAKVVPVSIEIGGNHRIMIISGPNTGGKTVCLKTVGLFCLMAYIGLRLPCDDGSEISVFENIFCDIGDEQSIEQSLSTFSSHINNIVYITDNLTPGSLVLIDEIGAGTDPEEGAALAIGLLKYFELMKSVAIITTHYSKLKEYAFLSDKVINACMVFDEKTLKPAYKIIIGMPGSSNALKIAKNLGINDYVLKNALENLGDDQRQFEKVLQSAEEIKFEAMGELEKNKKLALDLELERRRLQAEHNTLSEKLEKINFNAKMEIKRQVSNAVEEADEIIESIKNKLKEADEAALLEAKKLKKQLENLEFNYSSEVGRHVYREVRRDELKPGMKVVIKSLDSLGELKTLPNKKDEVAVSVGIMQLNVKITDIAVPEAPPDTKITIRPHRKATNASDRQDSGGTITKEIKVLGMTVSEAIEEIEPYIIGLHSEAGEKILKIVHGKGTGALGRGLQSFLKTHPLVISFRYGKYGEGETGVTIAEIK